MSYIVKSYQEVIIDSTAAIKKIYSIRSDRDEERISKCMRYSRETWWKFWTPVGVSREKAIQILDSENFYGWRSQYGYSRLELLKTLLLMAEHGDPVTLDGEAVNALYGMF